MPFPFPLPTTSNCSFASFVTSSTHPSLPVAATTHRAVFQNVLKKHRKLDVRDQASNLNTVLAAVLDYLPYLVALKAGIIGRAVSGDSLHLEIKAEIFTQWRATLTENVPGKRSSRVEGKGVDFEMCFALTTLALIYIGQARARLHALYGAVTPTAEQRLAIITAATKLLLEANSIHHYLSSHAPETDASTRVVETLTQTQGGLAALAMAEATLLAVLKDDPYPAVIVQERNRDDKEWMIKPPEIPKVRAHLFGRLCLAAAEHVSKAEAMLSASGRLNDDLITYVNNLKKTCRARACRFFGIDAELGGETGTGIAWLVGAKTELGFAAKANNTSKLKGLAKLKKDWSERREDRRVEKGGEWGGDAGRLEELRIVEMLEDKWNKMNDTINTQLVPSSNPLIASLPSGRDVHSTKPFVLPELDHELLTEMRAPPDTSKTPKFLSGDESSDEDEETKAPPGSFPEGPSNVAHDSSYY